MADMAASVLARLKNKAKESGRSYQLCLQLFCQEEFLRRLEKSKYAENNKGIFNKTVCGSGRKQNIYGQLDCPKRSVDVTGGKNEI